MAAQVDLLRAKVEEEKVRDRLDRFIREKKNKKKKKRDASPSADKREKSAKEEKKVKLHHHHHNHQHGEHRTYQPHQLQQSPKPHKFSADKHVPHIHPQSHHHHHHHPCHNRGLTNGTKNLQPTLPPPPPAPQPRKVPEQLQKKKKKQAVLSEPTALFTFTPLKVVKAKPQDFKEKHRDKDLKLKKENTEAKQATTRLLCSRQVSSLTHGLQGETASITFKHLEYSNMSDKHFHNVQGSSSRSPIAHSELVTLGIGEEEGIFWTACIKQIPAHLDQCSCCSSTCEASMPSSAS